MKLTYKFTSILILGVVFAASFLPVIKNVVVAAEISVPTITVNPDVYYPLDEVLYLEGIAEPNFTVEVRFQKQGAKPVVLIVKSNPRGEWLLAEKVSLGAGDWEVRGRTVDTNDQNKVSQWSAPRTFKVVISGIMIGGFNVKFSDLSLVIIILLIGGIFLILYSNSRIRRLKAVILNKEIKEASESIHEEFVELEQSLRDELKLLELRQNPSPEDLERKEQVIRNIENLEKNIQKDIQYVEDKI